MISLIEIDYVSSTNAPASYVAEGEALLAAAVPIKHRQSLVRSVSTASPSARHSMCYDLGIGRRLQRAFSKKHTAKKVIPKHMLKEKKRKEPAGRQPH